MSTLFAGLDVSTQGCKLLIIDHTNEEVVYTTSVNYDNDLSNYDTINGVIKDAPEGVSESEPQMWLDAVDMVFSQAKDDNVTLSNIKCIAVSGQQHGLVSLDENDNLTRNRSKLWNDFSTAEECQILTNKIGGKDSMIEEIGNTQRTGYTASKIFHMQRNEPNKYDKTRTFFLVHNYINWYLTGGVKVMEPGDTSGMALWNPKNGQWSQKVINIIDPGLKDKLPPVKPAYETIGTISKNLANKFGFSPECKIDAGSGDNMYGAIGTGNVESGIVTISLGTSGTAYTFMEKPYIDPDGEIAAFCDSTGHYLPLVCVSNMANGYNQVLDNYNIDHQEFVNIIGEVKPGNGGRILLPWYEGERTPDLPNAAPIYFGFDLGDFTKENLCRAVIEGHVLNIYAGFERMPIDFREIRLTGGLSKSPAWRQMIADVFEAEAVPVEGEGAALGAAIHAGWVWLNESDQEISISEIVKSYVKLKEKERCKPNKNNRKIYDNMKRLFKSLSQRIRGLAAEDPFIIKNNI
ncbi:MAG: xylulokinase [Candidatus Marinimicrobia bacterium]|nr:xylulokinase [Candidatus Neomarinimicrobiota bacterium]